MVRKLVSLHRISINHVQLPRECGRKKAGTNYLQKSGQKSEKHPENGK
jgi:hypothetical protein